MTKAMFHSLKVARQSYYLYTIYWKKQYANIIFTTTLAKTGQIP